MLDPGYLKPHFKDSDTGGVLNLGNYRKRIFYYFCLVMSVAMVPFTISNIVQSRFLVAFITIIVLAVSVVNVVTMRGTMEPAIRPEYAILPPMLGIPLAIVDIGTLAVYWAYIGVIAFAFILKPAVALRFSLIFLSLILISVVMVIDFQHGVRIIFTLALTIAFSHIFSNVIENQQEALSKLVITDPLTGALNRHSMEKSLHNAIERCKRHRAQSSIITLDIDHFKNINDELGHVQGDTVLKEMVKLIQTRLRSFDSLFRFGGEEFIILAPDTNLKNAFLLAEDIRMLVADSKLISNRQITISCGVGEVVRDDTSVSLFSRVDAAMYTAKRHGRNQVVKAYQS